MVVEWSQRFVTRAKKRPRGAVCGRWEGMGAFQVRPWPALQATFLLRSDRPCSWDLRLIDLFAASKGNPTVVFTVVNSVTVLPIGSALRTLHLQAVAVLPIGSALRTLHLLVVAVLGGAALLGEVPHPEAGFVCLEPLPASCFPSLLHTCIWRFLLPLPCLPTIMDSYPSGTITPNKFFLP